MSERSTFIHIFGYSGQDAAGRSHIEKAQLRVHQCVECWLMKLKRRFQGYLPESWDKQLRSMAKHDTIAGKYAEGYPANS